MGDKVRPLYVVGVADEIFGGHLPVAGNDPLVDAAKDLASTLPPVEQGVEVPGHGPEVVEQGRRVVVESSEYEALVGVELGDRDETPLGLVKLVVVGVLQVGTAASLPSAL